MKIKKGDTVKVIAGKDRGKAGAVLEVFPSRERVVVDGVNTQIRHTKNRRVRSQGQIVERNAPIHVSNVALIENDKPVRVGYSVKEGTKVRVSRKTGKEI